MGLDLYTCKMHVQKTVIIYSMYIMQGADNYCKL